MSRGSWGQMGGLDPEPAFARCCPLVPGITVCTTHAERLTVHSDTVSSRIIPPFP